MVIYKFPGTDGKSEKNGKRPEELIVITEEYSANKGGKGLDFKLLNPIKGVWGRLLFFLGACLAAIWAIASLMLLLVALPIGILTFFKWHPLQEIIRKYWVMTKGGFIMMVGFGISVFSPFLGMGMLCFYFMAMRPEFSQAVFWERVQNIFIQGRE